MIKSIRIHSVGILITLVLFLSTACGDKYNPSNAVPYTSEMEVFLGKWSWVYYTDKKYTDHIEFVKYGDWVQARVNDNLVFPEVKGNKISLRVEEAPIRFYEGTFMGNRLWGTLKMKSGEYSNQRIQWEGNRVE